MAKFFILLALFVVIGVTQAWFDEFKPQNGYEALHAKLMVAAKKLSETSSISAGATSNLRPEVVATASSYVVQQSWTASTTCGGSPSKGYAVGLNQCYPLSTGYGMATVAGNTLTGTSYTDNACTQGASVVGSLPLNTCTAAAPSSGNFVVVSGSGIPSSYAAGAVGTYFPTLANCQAGSGVIYGWEYTASGCTALGGGTSASSSCSGNTQTYNVYATSTSCSGTPSFSGSATGAGLCTADTLAFGPLIIPAYGTYISCFTPPAAAASTCFAGSETVELASGAIVPISEVKVGDKVLAFSASAQSTVFSDVVATPHPKNNNEAVFQHISLASGKDIKLTADHLVAAGKCDLAALPLARAADVETGDCVQTTEGSESFSFYASSFFVS